MKVPFSLIQKADTLFREHMLIIWGSPERIQCASCLEFFIPDFIDVGHILGRGSHAVRWIGDNTVPQCRGCNRSKAGAGIWYDTKILSSQRISELEAAHRNPNFRLTTDFVLEVINRYA